MEDVVPTHLLLETPSGLYTRGCFSCGKRLQLQPLHSLVMTGYHLATQGRDGEDLFGIVACALCLIFHGFDPSVRADVSVAALLSHDSCVECDHVELTAAELAENILAKQAFDIWNTRLRTGWIVLAGVLRRCEAAHVERVNQDLLDDSDSISLDELHESNHFMGFTEPDHQLASIHNLEWRGAACYFEQSYLGALWSSVQAELLSYRRLNDGIGWTSQYFSMEALREQLERGEDLTVGYTEHNLLKAHCACHSFGRLWLTMLSDVVDPALANINDVWGRASYGAESGFVIRMETARGTAVINTSQ